MSSVSSSVSPQRRRRESSALRTAVCLSVMLLLLLDGVQVHACKCVERTLAQHYCDWAARYVAEVKVVDSHVDGKYRVYETDVLRIYKPKSSVIEKMSLFTPLPTSEMWDYLSGGCSVELRVGAAYFVVPFNHPAGHGHSRQVLTVCEFVREAGALTAEQVAFLEQPNCEDVFDEPHSGSVPVLPSPKHGASRCDNVACPVSYHCEMRQPTYCVGSPACTQQSVCVADPEKH